MGFGGTGVDGQGLPIMFDGLRVPAGLGQQGA